MKPDTIMMSCSIPFYR